MIKNHLRKAGKVNPGWVAFLQPSWQPLSRLLGGRVQLQLHEGAIIWE